MVLNVKRVKELLKFRNWTQADLARETGISKSQVTLLMNGSRNITGEVLDRLCEASGLPPNELVITEKKKGKRKNAK